MTYTFDNTYRGIALVIGNEFKGTRFERKGCRKDLQMMKELFIRLDFRVIVYKDLTTTRMQEKIKAASEDEMNMESDCFVLVISSHGLQVNDDNTWRQTILCADDGKIYVEDLVDILKSSKQLADKPKLLFIQACRHKDVYVSDDNTNLDQYDNLNQYDPGLNVSVIVDANEDRSETAGLQETQIDERIKNAIYGCDLSDTKDIYSSFKGDSEEWCPENDELNTCRNNPPKADSGPIDDDITSERRNKSDANAIPNDFLLMYPVMPGMFSWRDDDNGSFMFQDMYNAENAKMLFKGHNILQYLTKVCGAMAKFDLKSCSWQDLRSMFFQSIPTLCKDENVHIIKKYVPINSENRSEREREKEVKDYFASTRPGALTCEESKFKQLVVAILGADYDTPDCDIDYMLYNFQSFLEIIGSSENLKTVHLYFPESGNSLYNTETYLKQRFRTIAQLAEFRTLLVEMKLLHGNESISASNLIEKFPDFIKQLCSAENVCRLQELCSGLPKDDTSIEVALESHFYIISRTFEMKKILFDMFPFKTTACVYHRLRDCVCFFKPKDENSKMSKVLEQLEKVV